LPAVYAVLASNRDMTKDVLVSEPDPQIDNQPAMA